MIDTHAHLDDKKYDKDRLKVIKRAFNKGVSQMITVGADLETSKAAVDLAQQYPQVYATVGIHPHCAGATLVVASGQAQDLSLQRLAQQSKVIAIGEAGLECPDKNCEDKKLKKQQKELFLMQATIADKLNLPVVVHCRKAHNQMIELLSEIKPKKAVIHCFSGSWPQAERYLDLGYYLSFTGIITYARDYDKVIKNAPLEKIMAETDCPYLAPVPYRGSRNEPAYVKYVYQVIARVRGENFNKIEKQLDKNAVGFFKLF